MDKWYNVNKLHIMKKMKWICWLIPGKREKNHLFITSERVIMKGEKMEKIKELKDPDLVDRFLFAEVMEDEGSLADVLEIILGREVVLKGLPQVEKEFRKNVWSRQVRLDVCTKDVFDNVYDTEVQKRKTHGLPQRTRFYNGVIDCKLLEPGDDYINLNDVFIIMIMPFDLFGKGLYRYTFDMS